VSSGVDRVFLDANVLFSAAYVPGSRLSELWAFPGVKLVTSDLALEEARRNLLAYRPEGVAALAELAARMEVVPSVSARPRLPRGVALPNKDLPILAAAIAVRCTYLLTGDKRHFGALYGRRVGGVRVLTPGEYLRGRKGQGQVGC